MSPVVETILFVFGLVALGYLAGLTGYLKVEVGDALTEFAVGVALPLLLFRTMIAADFQGSAPWSLWAAYFSAAAVAWTAGHLVTTRIFGRDSQAGVVGGVATAFSNLLLLGLPFMQGVFGRQGIEILSLIIAVHLPVMIIASIMLFGIFGRGGGSIDPLQVMRSFLRRIVKNPLVVGILIGLAWRMTGLELPTLAARLVDALAGIAGSLALFAMGLGLRKFGISGNVMPALVLSALKLFLMPAVALGAALLLGLPPVAAKVAVAAAALPSGVNSYLIATQFGTGQALASNQMTITTALAVATTAFWLTVAQAVFG
ncbi:AEC family transporter [Mesorhizobium sp. KR9-304]|uniref:AEC family transporter n=1 Tax=Mesorhizobium sp. KR9-304 TaxID=3156614 RepID=UPI0032B535AC